MMKLLSRKDIEQSIGKLGLFNRPVLTGKLRYVSGIEVFDNLFETESFWSLPGLINLIKRPQGFEIELFKDFKSYYVELHDKELQRIDLESKEQIYEKQEKSVVGRAIVGSLIAGPLGAIIGGMSGIGTKDVKQQMPDLILSITFRDDSGSERVILFSLKHKDKPEIDRFFEKVAIGKYNRPVQA